MNLTDFQQEFLLEILSGEYFISESCQNALKDAVKRYASADYTSEDIAFLASLPQSLTADLYLYHRRSFKSFSDRFLLWLNILEYDLTDSAENTLAYLINPDPTSKEKILRLSRDDDRLVINAVPTLYFAKAEQMPDTSFRRSLSLVTFKEAEYLLRDFLNFASQNPAKIPSAHTDYLLSMEDNLKRTKKHRLSWTELRQKMQDFPAENEEYTFLDRSLGLITPSTLQIISLLGAKPLQSAVKRRPNPQAPSKPFSLENTILGRVKNILKNPAIPHSTGSKGFPFLPPAVPKMRPKAHFSKKSRPHATQNNFKTVPHPSSALRAEPSPASSMSCQAKDDNDIAALTAEALETTAAPTIPSAALSENTPIFNPEDTVLYSFK